MFDESFRICFADTSFGVVLHQRIRYEVSCLEKGLRDPEAFSAVQETDAWDDQSAHFIVQNKNVRQWVAATRLVLPRTGRPLPVDTLNALDRSMLDDPTARIGEVSRFCIIGNWSQIDVSGQLEPESNSLEALGIGAIGRKQRFEVTLGMLRAVCVYALKHNVDYCIMIIPDAFARLLRKLGVMLCQAGPAIKHRGMRAAYLVDIRESVMSMAGKSSALRHLFKRSKHAYVQISSVSGVETGAAISEHSPDLCLSNKGVLRDAILYPAERDVD